MIEVNFNGENELAVTNSLYQYDYGQTLQITGLELPNNVEIHFSLDSKAGESVTVIGSTVDNITTVDIPNDLLRNETATKDYVIYVFIYVADENEGKTVKKIALHVKARPMPTDLEDLDDDQTRLLEQLITLIGGKADNLTYSNNVLKLLAGDTELASATISGGGSGTPSELDEFINNIDLDYEYDEATNANYTIVRVYRDKLDGTKQYPFVYAPNGAEACQMSTYEISHNDGWLLAINGGIFNTTTHKADGLLVENGAIYQNSQSVTHPQCRPLIISNTGELSEGAYNADATTLVANGAISVICGFMAIVKDYNAVPSSEWNSVAHYTQNAQRQIIGQFGNGDYAIITCEGRNFDNSDGWTIEEAQSICLKHGLKFAYNLDGGGSTETMLGLKHINSIYEGTDGRKVPTFIVFNGKDTFTDEPSEKVLSSITATKAITSYQVGDTLSADDITVIAHYSDGTVNDVTTSAVINTSLVDMSTSGTYAISITYTEDNITKTTTINITVASETPTLDYEWLRGYTTVNTGELAINTARLTALTQTENSAPIYIEGNGLAGYLIPIPSNSTSVTVTTPNYISGVGLWNANKERIIDGGWSATEEINTHTYTSGTYAYLSVNVKNSSNSTIPVDVDTTNWTIEFN